MTVFIAEVEYIASDVEDELHVTTLARLELEAPSFAELLDKMREHQDEIILRVVIRSREA